MTERNRPPQSCEPLAKSKELVAGSASDEGKFIVKFLEGAPTMSTDSATVEAAQPKATRPGLRKKRAMPRKNRNNCSGAYDLRLIREN
jgi:hypothetical protein